MRTRLLILILIITSIRLQAQNLVSNNGFENLASIITIQGQFLAAVPWQLPGASTGTPDVFTSFYSGPPATPCDLMSVPVNTGGFANAQSGNNYAGISVSPANNQYEYITIKLDAALDPGDIYILDFWVQLADNSRYKLNKIGGLLTTSLPVQGGSGVLPFSPQYESANATILGDSLNWTHLQFTPYQATGGEQYLTIGFFRQNGDPNFTVTDMGSKNTGCNSFDDAAYYYIDEVSLTPNTPIFYLPSDTVCICPYNYAVSLEAIANVGVVWSNVAGDTVGTGNLLQIPDQPGMIFQPGEFYTYYAFGNGTLDSIIVKVVDVPVVNLGPDTAMCELDSVLLDAYQSDAIQYTWSTGDTTSFIYAADTGEYWVVVDNCGCPAYDTVYFNQKLPNQQVELGEDSLYCFFNYDSLRLNAFTPDAVSYLWSPTGETSKEITVKYEGDYYVIVSKENGCKSKDGFEVIELCPPTFFIPNAFTPDDDGVNDVWYVPVTNYVTYTLRVYDRFGRLIFRSENPAVGWNGTYEGKQCPVGVYTYKLNINGFTVEGEKDPRKYMGTLTLYR